MSTCALDGIRSSCLHFVLGCAHFLEGILNGTLLPLDVGLKSLGDLLWWLVLCWQPPKLHINASMVCSSVLTRHPMIVKMSFFVRICSTRAKAVATPSKARKKGPLVLRSMSLGGLCCLRLRPCKVPETFPFLCLPQYLLLKEALGEFRGAYRSFAAPWCLYTARTLWRHAYISNIGVAPWG